MRIIIVDDRPFFMWDTIEKLKGMEVDTIVMLYFHGPLTYRAEKDSAIEQKCEELNIKLIHITSRLDFRNQLDKYYSDEDTLFFIDYNLGESEDFENKIDIICAKEKMQQKNDFRIWFYTASGAQTVARLNKIFDWHTIPVVKFIPQEYVLKLDYDNMCYILQDANIYATNLGHMNDAEEYANGVLPKPYKSGESGEENVKAGGVNANITN